MITRTQAEDIVMAELARRGAGEDVVIVDESTVERPFGWLFIYNTRHYLETGDPRDALVGNDPWIVDRRDGSLHEGRTSQTIEQIIAAYEAAHPVESGEEE